VSGPRVYLDHNATSPASREHLAEVFCVLEQGPANPSSPHAAGRDASVAVTAARRSLAQAIGFDVAEIVFVSGGTEANNLATAGVLAHSSEDQGKGKGVHAVTSGVEHPSILEPLREAQRTSGVSLDVLAVSDQGDLKVDAIKSALRPDTRLVTLMAANNETGVILPVKAFGDWLHQARWAKTPDADLFAGLAEGVTRESLQAMHFHVDGVQAFGKLPTSEWISPGVDSVSLCAHKLGGLPGVGALALRRGRRYVPGLRGGAQEKNRRAGTENIPGIVSFGLVARAVSGPAWWTSLENVAALRDELRAGLEALAARPGAPCLIWNTPRENILPTTLNFSVAPPRDSVALKNAALRGEDVLMQLDMRGVCASSGSACSSGANLPSKILLALGRSDREARDAVRLSLGVSTIRADVEFALAALGDIFKVSTAGSAVPAAPGDTPGSVLRPSP